MEEFSGVEVAFLTASFAANLPEKNWASFFLDFSETRKIAQIALLFILFSFVNDKRFLIYGFILGVFISSLITGINIINYYLNSLNY